jgi:hypothetical protein
MLLDGNILSTAESLSRLRPVSGKTGGVRGSKTGAFSGCGSSRVDDRRTANAAPRRDSVKKARGMCAGLIPGPHTIRTSQAPLHMPSRIGCLSALDHESGTGHVLPGSRPFSELRLNHSMGMAAKPYSYALSYFSLTLCCVTPYPGWHGGHATLHSAEAGLGTPATGKPVGYRRDRISSCRVRPWPRHFVSHLPNVGRALKLYPLINGITNLGRKFVQGQIGPIDCKEEFECKPFDSVRACGSEGCEKRLRREGRVQPRPSHLFTIRLRPVFP